MTQDKNKFSETLVWDCHLEPADYNKYSRLIVDRVVHRGNLEDWHLMKSLFGLERVKEELLNIKSLNPRVLRAMSKLFDIPLSEFRAYKRLNGDMRFWWERQSS